MKYTIAVKITDEQGASSTPFKAEVTGGTLEECVFDFGVALISEHLALQNGVSIKNVESKAEIKKKAVA